jgi:integrase
MATKRKTPSGKWEFRVTNKLLPKTLYFTYEDEKEGAAYVATIEDLLRHGTVPAALHEKTETKTLFRALIREYQVKNDVSKSDKDRLAPLMERWGHIEIEKINHNWLEDVFLADLKHNRGAKPATIRHYIGALKRCFNWAVRRDVMQVNPVFLLPYGCSTYNEHDAAKLKKARMKDAPPANNERDRRLEDGEEERITASCIKYHAHGNSGRVEPMLLMFHLAVETAMRMREIWTLERDRIDLKKRVIFLPAALTKSERDRSPPLSSVATKLLTEYMSHFKTEIDANGGRLFPWWNGTMDERVLSGISRNRSTIWRRVFDKAGCFDLHFHDLRHEAVCRLFERTAMSEIEIMKIVGHMRKETTMRYANLRPENLAAKMW